MISKEHQFDLRRNITKLRISFHKLEIEVSRYTSKTKREKTDSDKRLCKKCALGEVEDEKHAIMTIGKPLTLYLDCCYLSKRREGHSRTVVGQMAEYTSMSLTKPLVTLLYTSFILCTKHLMCICNIMNSIIWRC